MEKLINFKSSLLGAALLGTMVILPACVTINIYFPAAAAEKAADKIIDDVWQLKDGQPNGSEPTVNTKEPTAPAK
ncbi:MAG: hypothetical protein CTY33_01540 [Methylotenera sp.]|nr:MAG: hypothetical protein CTY33_01540 [Methylotenera sp.]